MKIKAFTKIIGAVALAAALLTTVRASAQTVLAGWDVNGLTGSGPTSYAATAANPNLIVGGLTKGAGITNTTTANVWGANGWTNTGVADSEANSIIGNKFITFTMQARPGYTLSMTSISKFYVSKSGTGPASGALQYSLDGTTFTDITPLTYGAQGTAISASSIGTVDLSGVAALQNLTSSTTVTMRIVNWGATGFAGTWYIGNGNTSGSDLEFQGTLTSSGVAPNNLVVAPSSVTTNAGSTVSFAVTANGDPASSQWYKVVGSTTNLIAGATSASLTLPNVLAGDSASYYVVLSNLTGTATSSLVNLTVTGDPSITSQPASVEGLIGGTAQFSVAVAATSPAFQWYHFDGVAGYTPLSDGTQPSGSVVSGANSGTLTITNLQYADPTNFVVIVGNAFGSVTSIPVSLLSVSNTATLAFWDFNASAFTNHVLNPPPFIGVGFASAVGSCLAPGTSPFSGSVDPEDGAGFTTNLPNFSWGTANYPASGSNKMNGVQFNVSTVGAKNIAVSYDSRVSATASDYERLQYTIDGTTWIDYPSSSTFGGHGTTYFPFSYSLAGFPGVDNNPNFGVRIVTEFQNTATYGIGTTAGYVGTANTYGTAGTVTYDIVNISGDAITNHSNLPPTVSHISDTNTPDYVNLTLHFTVSDDTTPPDSLTYSAVSLNPTTVYPQFTFGGSGADRTLTITPNFIPDQIDAAPILLTVTDANGDSTATWFTLTLTSINLSPTNSLTSLGTTNTLANSPITIPFTVADDRTAVSGLTYSVASANNTVVPAANIVVNGAGTATPSVTITPAHNQLGLANISVTVSDNDSQEPRSSTANIALLVRPNTNVIALDYFNYDNGGALDSISAGYWGHLSGVLGQMQAGAGVVTVDTVDNTENLQAKLLGAPYRTNSGAVLYSSFIINMNPTLDPTKMPVNNGTYFALFNDGSGVTGPYECRVVASTNAAAPGFYRIGINNFGADANSGVTFPQDLSPNSNYVVVTSLVLSNGFSTVWINPSSPTSPSVTDNTPASSASNLFNIAQFELRESGANGGSVNVSRLKVGTTFDSVLPALQIQEAGNQAVVNWSDPTLDIQAATNVAGPYLDLPGATAPYTNSPSANGSMFFRFKR